MSIEVKIKDESLQGMLRELIQKLGNLKLVMNSIGEDVVESVLTNFEAGGKPTAWPALAESTIRQRIKQNKWPGMILACAGEPASLFVRAFFDEFLGDLINVHNSVKQYSWPKPISEILARLSGKRIDKIEKILASLNDANKFGTLISDFI
jgi:hypothetical protein